MKFVFLAMMASSGAFGQAFHGTLRGRVLDPHGAAAAAAARLIQPGVRATF